MPGNHPVKVPTGARRVAKSACRTAAEILVGACGFFRINAAKSKSKSKSKIKKSSSYSYSGSTPNPARNCNIDLWLSPLAFCMMKRGIHPLAHAAQGFMM